MLGLWQSAMAQSTIVFMSLKNNNEQKLKLIQETGYAPKVFAFIAETKKWQLLDVLKYDQDEQYIKFKHHNGFIYHCYLFDERQLVLLDAQGTVWRYYKLNNYAEPTTEHVNTAKDCSNSMSKKEFDQLQNDIKTLAFDKTKFSTAKSFLRGYCLTSQQVAQLLLNFESDQFRYDFAHYMYHFTSDKQLYKQVLKQIKSPDLSSKLTQALGIQ